MIYSSRLIVTVGEIKLGPGFSLLDTEFKKMESTHILDVCCPPPPIPLTLTFTDGGDEYTSFIVSSTGFVGGA